MRQAVAVNESGQRIGETHHRAKLTDRDIDLMRELHEEHGIGYTKLAEKFECSKSEARYICRYMVRCQTAARWRNVLDKMKGAT